jgi:hypothetical protein
VVSDNKEELPLALLAPVAAHWDIPYQFIQKRQALSKLDQFMMRSKREMWIIDRNACTEDD